MRLIYRGGPPVHWTGGGFGVQDRDGGLVAPAYRQDGAMDFDFSVDVRIARDGAIDFGGAFVHGPRGGRFVYLAWRNANGAYAQRFKLPLENLTVDRVDRSRAEGRPITATLAVAEQRATRAGSNIGGTRVVDWR